MTTDTAALVLDLTRALANEATPPRPVALTQPRINREVWDSMMTSLEVNDVVEAR